MGWARLDDGFHDHPKLIGLSLEALGLWTKCLTWAHRHHGSSPVLGHIPEGLPSMFAQARGEKLAAELVRHRLWDPEEALGGWAIHDYVDFLPAAEKPQTAGDVSRARAEAGRRGAAKRWGRNPPSDPTPDGNLPSASHAPDGKPIASDSKWQMAPTRPDPIARSSNEDLAHSDAVPASPREPSTALTVIREAPTPNPRSSYPPGFETFWALYPRHEGKRKAATAWRAACRRATEEDIADGARRYRDDPNREEAYTAHPTTWLNRDGWQDAPLPRRRPESQQDRLAESAARMFRDLNTQTRGA